MLSQQAVSPRNTYRAKRGSCKQAAHSTLQGTHWALSGIYIHSSGKQSPGQKRLEKGEAHHGMKGFIQVK